MRALLILLLVATGTTTAFSQPEKQLLGSWEIVSVESPFDEELSSAQERWVGARFHFSENYVIIETGASALTIPISYEPQVRYENFVLEVLDASATHLQLMAVDLVQDEETDLQLEPCAPLEIDFEQKCLSLPTGKSSVGANYEGLYYHYDATDTTYHYFRFLPNNMLSTYDSDLAPQEFVKLIRPFAFAKESFVEIYTRKRNGTAYEYSLFDGGMELVLAETPKVLYSDYEFYQSATEDKLILTKYRYYAGQKEVDSFESISLDFHASANLPYTTPLPEDRKRKTYISMPIAKTVWQRDSDMDEMPRFPGCEDKNTIEDRLQCSQQELLRFIYKNIKYPSEARESGIQGTAVVSFTIQADGSVADIHLIQDIGGGCGEESLRLVGIMHYEDIIWTPGKHNGQAVSCRFNLPIKFRLE